MFPFLSKTPRFQKILDFGGMFAENKLYLEKLYNLNITYDVVETKKSYVTWLKVLIIVLFL